MKSSEPNKPKTLRKESEMNVSNAPAKKRRKTITFAKKRKKGEPSLLSVIDAAPDKNAELDAIISWANGAKRIDPTP